MTQEPKAERDLEARLDEALEMTFPASDPIAVHLPDPFPTGPEASTACLMSERLCSGGDQPG
jgi:hypothetical protein